MESSDHWENFAASTGWMPCADCGVWHDGKAMYEHEEQRFCWKCYILDRCEEMANEAENLMNQSGKDTRPFIYSLGQVTAYAAIARIVEEMKS